MKQMLLASMCIWSFSSILAKSFPENLQGYRLENDDGHIVIPHGVTCIGERAFSHTRLRSIVIPNTVTTIGEDAFAGCVKLRSIIIPNSVTTIGEYAFHGCDKLESVTLPKGLTRIEDALFSGCVRLQSIVIPNGVTKIGDEAFRYCEFLQSVTIPSSVKSIGNEAFSRLFFAELCVIYTEARNFEQLRKMIKESGADLKNFHFKDWKIGFNTFNDTLTKSNEQSGQTESLNRKFNEQHDITQMSGVTEIKTEEANNTISLLSGKELYNLGVISAQSGDTDSAIKYYKDSINQGFAAAENNLGWMYYIGNGVKVDYSEAVKWFKQSASKDCGLAQESLARCYYKGRGIEKNFNEAFKLFMLSAKNKDRRFGSSACAMFGVAKCLYLGRGCDRNEVEAMDWLIDSANEGDRDAMYMLGDFLEKGICVKKNPKKSTEWFQKAMKAGHKLAKRRLYGIPIDASEFVDSEDLWPWTDESP